ncbi:hypothetical protein FDF74_05610 [Clostridium niameyense]|uniref:Uncharacterized protein n=1 Tax=Clostridium niameyense TaxID=1622073 RepID=A0A6M0R8X2_9CLOT|nr:hypothetical protein [Clostridium niameyense]NEZ46691.1 hypothetical protein [Clostridium niameyense]
MERLVEMKKDLRELKFIVLNYLACLLIFFIGFKFFKLRTNMKNYIILGLVYACIAQFFYKK